MNEPRRIRISPLAAMALVASALAFAPSEPPREPLPPERRPPPPKTPSGNAFHDHLDACRWCQENPMALCQVGAAALRKETLGITENGFRSPPPSPPMFIADPFESRAYVPRSTWDDTRSVAQWIRVAHHTNSDERTISAAQSKRARKAAGRLARKAGAK